MNILFIVNLMILNELKWSYRLSLPIMSTFEHRTINIFRTRSSVSFEHMIVDIHFYIHIQTHVTQIKLSVR